MRKLRRLLLRFFVFLLLLLIGILAVNTFLSTSKQVAVPEYKAPIVPEDVVSHLQEAIRIKTISQPELFDSTAFFAFNSFLSNTFPLVDSILDHQIINEFSHIYTWKGKDESLKPILLIAHIDVVPVEPSSLEAWQQAPFAGNLFNGELWGRGTLDDKLNVVGIMEAAELLLEQQYRPTRTIYFAFGHDEEISGEKGAKAMANHFEKRGIRFSYILDEGSLVIEDALNGLDAPAALIGITEKGYVSLDLKVNLEKGGHSSMPPKSSAIGILSNGLATLEANPFPGKIDGAVGEMFDFLGPEMNFPFKTIFANRWLFGGILKSQLSNAPTTNAITRTTTALTIFNAGIKDNVLPSEAKATVNFRILPGENPQSVLEYVTSVIDDQRIAVSFANENAIQSPSAISPTKGFGFNILQTTIKELFPESVIAPSLVIAATDARRYVDCSDAIYRFMPVQLRKERLSSIHGIDERIGISDYHKVVQFYIRLLQNSTR